MKIGYFYKNLAVKFSYEFILSIDFTKTIPSKLKFGIDKGSWLALKGKEIIH